MATTESKFPFSMLNAGIFHGHVSCVINAPVAVAGHLTSYSTNTIRQDQWEPRHPQMQNGDLFLLANQITEAAPSNSPP